MTRCIIHELAVRRHRCQGVGAVQDALVQRIIVERVGGQVGSGSVCFQESITQFVHVIEHIRKQHERIPVRFG